MKRKKSFVIAAVVSLAAMVSVAYAGTWTGPGTVTKVFAGYTDGSVYVSGLEKKNPNCSSSTIQFRTTESDPAKIQKLALAAMLSGKQLTCQVDDNVCTANNKYQLGYQCSIQ